SPAATVHFTLSLHDALPIYLGNTAKAEEIFRGAISRNPDNDQYYLSLTLVQLRSKDVSGAEQTLQKGLTRIPSSGKILWGMRVRDRKSTRLNSSHGSISYAV